MSLNHLHDQADLLENKRIDGRERRAKSQHSHMAVISRCECSLGQSLSFFVVLSSGAEALPGITQDLPQTNTWLGPHTLYLTFGVILDLNRFPFTRRCLHSLLLQPKSFIVQPKLHRNVSADCAK